jgi:hypothetical protein
VVTRDYVAKQLYLSEGVMTSEHETAALLAAFEVHDPTAISQCLADGVSPTAPIKGLTPLMALVEMYTRSDRLAACVQVLLNAGATLDDPFLEAVLLDDAVAVARLISASPTQRDRRWDLQCAYTSLHGASALHLCAEYNRVCSARALLDAGHNVDARAAYDVQGFGGQTPLFHTVNSNRNHCRPMLELLLAAGASLDVRLKGLVWGRGFDWETTVVDVTPLSYAQCGNYFQFHRHELDVHSNVSLLFERVHGAPLVAANVPNKYLSPGPTQPPRM